MLWEESEAPSGASPAGIAMPASPSASLSPLTSSGQTPPSPAGEASGRWNGTAWLFWRERAQGAALSSAGQLGGSQAGMRIDRRIGQAGTGGEPSPVLVYGRITRALDAPHQGEAALGLAIKPLNGRTALTVGIERRVAMESGARNAFALIVAGGLNPTRLIGPVMAEGYAQAGIVGASQQDLFADGRLSLRAPLDRTQKVRAGISFSGGAQPGVSRLDIGPMAETRLPLGTAQPRLVVEWRQRIAGQARPGSGLSVTLAADF